MSIKNKEHHSDPTAQRLARKRDQEWDMAGLARKDGDLADAARHTDKAREYAQQLHDYLHG